MKKDISVYRGRGTLFRFKNGWTVSIQIGFGTYSDNHNTEDYMKMINANFVESNTAEVWAWNKEDTIKYPEYPEAYINTDEVLIFMNKVANFKPDYKPEENSKTLLGTFWQGIKKDLETIGGVFNRD